jgi:hypothetical protein
LAGGVGDVCGKVRPPCKTGGRFSVVGSVVPPLMVGGVGVGVAVEFMTRGRELVGDCAKTKAPNKPRQAKINAIFFIAS